MDLIDLTDQTAVAWGLVIDWALRAGAAVAVLAVAGVISRALGKVLQRVFERVELDRTLRAFVQTLVRFTVWAIALLAALDQLGVNTTSVLASLGVLGLTVGFAAQNTLSNVISGLFIFWDRPFVIGDLVELDGEYGRVETITLRSTRLVTPDGRMLAIPNTVVANGKVASYTNFPMLRLDIDVTVAVDSDLGKVREVLLGLVGDRAQFAADPAPAVVVTALNDYNVALELRVWLRDETQHIPARFALREAVYGALTEAGVDMPFETLQLQPIEVRSRSA